MISPIVNKVVVSNGLGGATSPNPLAYSGAGGTNGEPLHHHHQAGTNTTPVVPTSAASAAIRNGIEQ